MKQAQNIAFWSYLIASMKGLINLHAIFRNMKDVFVVGIR